MIKVYLPLEIKGEDGKFYQTFEIQQGLPLGEEVIYIEPPKELNFPRWDRIQGIWVEDKDSIIESLKNRIAQQDEDIFNTQIALADVYEMLMGGL